MSRESDSDQKQLLKCRAMNEENGFRESSQAVQAHLGIMQAVIQRMASNSASYKTWCITLVSAILVIVADKGKPEYAWLALIPTVLFFSLDAYYLALEKMFRLSYNNFVYKLHQGRVVGSDLYVVVPSGNMVQTMWASILSFSIWPFYMALILMVLIAKKLVL
jgi:hypothetical protein